MAGKEGKRWSEEKGSKKTLGALGWRIRGELIRN